LVIAAARAQSERVSPRLRLAASSLVEYLTIRSFFTMARSSERYNPLIVTPPHPHDRIKRTVDLRSGNETVLVVAPRGGGCDRAAIEHRSASAKSRPRRLRFLNRFASSHSSTT